MKLLIKTQREITHLPNSARKVHVQHHLTTKMAANLLKQCPALTLVFMTNTAHKNASKSALAHLKSKGVKIKLDKRGAGRPTELTKEQLKQAEMMGHQDRTYAEIGEKLGVNASTIWRALKGKTKFKRRKDEYE